MGPPVLRRTRAASDVGVAESGMKSLVSPLLADTCRGGHGEADFISSPPWMKPRHVVRGGYHECAVLSWYIFIASV